MTSCRRPPNGNGGPPAAVFFYFIFFDRSRIVRARESLLPNILVPHFRILRDVSCEQGSALWRIKVHDFNSHRPQPLDSPLEIPALSDEHLPKSKLPNQPTAVPARCESRHHNEVSIATLAPRISKRIRLSMRRRIAILHAAIVSRTNQLSASIEDRGPNGNPTLRQSLPRFIQRHTHHRYVIQVRSSATIINVGLSIQDHRMPNAQARDVSVLACPRHTTILTRLSNSVRFAK